MTQQSLFDRSEGPRGLVYFLRCGDAMKIGYTTRDLTSRLAAFATGNPKPMTMIGAVPGRRSTERELHERCRPIRLRGEWFQAAPALLRAVVVIAERAANIAPDQLGHADALSRRALTQIIELLRRYSETDLN